MPTLIDRRLLYLVVFLLGLGLVQVYSSSFVFATESFDDGLYFFRRQLLFVAAGVLVLGVTALIPWRWLHLMGLLGFLLTCLALLASLNSDFGVKVGGARRWLPLVAGFRVEPAEFFKVLLPFWVALIIYSWRQMTPLGWRMLLIAFLVFPLGILLKQPDFGSFVLALAIVTGLMFCFGLYWRYVALAAAVVAPVFYFLIRYSDYRSARLMSFLNPWADPEESGFQVIQSMLSLYKGGATGVGLGQGQGKLFFLPEAHNDFTVAVLGEELGFIGLSMVMLIYVLFLLRCYAISMNCEDQRERAIGLGITLGFALSTVINFGVALGMLPTKGLALPFLSYGGSSLVASCLGIGIILNLDRSQSGRTLRKRFKGIE